MINPQIRTARGAAAALAAMLCVASRAGAADYQVKKDGTGNFMTVQACATAAAAGDRCIVHAGTYSEFVQTARNGTADKPIVFAANGAARVEGFRIRSQSRTVQWWAAVDRGTITIDLPKLLRREFEAERIDVTGHPPGHSRSSADCR